MPVVFFIALPIGRDDVAELGDGLRPRLPAFGAGAAALALFFVLRTPGEVVTEVGENGFAESFTVTEMTDCIERMVAVCGGRVRSVSMNPVGNAAIMTVNLNDNSSIKYLVTCNDDAKGASIIALGR